MIQAVIDRLTATTTVFSAILPAEELDALSRGVAPKSGTVFVLPYRERAEPNEHATGVFRQPVAVQILVAFVVRRHDDAKGGKRAASFDSFKSEIEQSLAGWAIAPEDEPFELVSGQIGSLGNGATIYVQTWQTSRTLEA